MSAEVGAGAWRLGALAQAPQPKEGGMGYCKAEDCFREVFANGLCRAHEMQRYRGRPLHPIKSRPESAKHRLEEAALELADADAENDGAYVAARRRFWRAFQAAVAELALKRHG